MIRVKFYRKEGRFFGFQLKGHAGYAEPGEDILCSAVSALAINTVNSLEELTKDRLIAEEHDGMGGQLSPCGGREHEQLALRMADRFPAVFASGMNFSIWIQPPMRMWK